MTRLGRPGLLLAMGLGIATWGSVLVIDRPAAFYAHDHFRDLTGLVALTHIVDPVMPLALAGFLVIGTALLLGWTAPIPVRIAFSVCVATLLAVVTKDQLKYAFGRTWPETWVNANPSLIRDGLMVFSPFHGGQGWASFPSGHTTLATAPTATLILASQTGWRWLCALPAGLVGVGLYGANYHYVADILAGAMVGILCAAITVATIRPERDRS